MDSHLNWRTQCKVANNPFKVGAQSASFLYSMMPAYFAVGTGKRELRGAVQSYAEMYQGGVRAGDVSSKNGTFIEGYNQALTSKKIKDTQSKAPVPAGGFLFLVKCSKDSHLKLAYRT